MLAEPKVGACTFDDAFQPSLGVMLLHWPLDTSEAVERCWQLPRGMTLTDSPPARFGIRIERWASDRYAVCLQWNDTSLHWPDLARADLLTTCLVELLSAMRTDLLYLLNQPIILPARGIQNAA